jgi:hypothetical protein
MLELVSAFQEISKRDFELVSADQDRLNPNNAVPLEAGEFVVTDPTETRKVTTSTFTTTKALARQVFTERGRTDTQAIKKVSTLWGHPYEAITNAFDAVVNGAIAVGDPLTILANADGRLVLAKAANAGEIVYGHSLSIVAVATAAFGSTRLQFVFVGPTNVL